MGGYDLTAMELMQLEMFVAVVEEGSVHRAADRVCRTQPAVSIALKNWQLRLVHRYLTQTPVRLQINSDRQNPLLICH